MNALWKWTMNNLWFFFFIDLPCVHFNAFYWIKQSKELSCCSLPEHNRYKTFVLFHSFTTALPTNRIYIKKKRQSNEGTTQLDRMSSVSTKKNRSLCSFCSLILYYSLSMRMKLRIDEIKITFKVNNFEFRCYK